MNKTMDYEFLYFPNDRNKINLFLDEPTNQSSLKVPEVLIQLIRIADRKFKLWLP